MGATIQTIVLTLLLIVLLYDLLTSRKTRYVITYEYMDITLSTKEDGEVILTDRLNDYGKDGWEVYHIASGFGKTIVFMRRKTVKETRAK